MLHQRNTNTALSTDCLCFRTWTDTFRQLAGSPWKMPQTTWEHLERLQTAQALSERIKWSLEHPDIDCSAIFSRLKGAASSGVYLIRPAGANQSVPAYCRMEGGQGWTVLLRRQDGSEDFYRTWDDYKRGFGNLTGEFWLGNDIIHLLTNQARSKLRVDLETWGGDVTYALYRTFSVSDEASAYKLTAGDYSGTAGDALLFSNGNAFVTRDRDTVFGQKAKDFKSAGWLYMSYFPNLLGVYYTPQTVPTSTQPDKMLLDSIRWYQRNRGRHPLLKFVEMRIAPEVT
ncbi:ryncolin-1-like [Branchiostoma floridae]|uniref:Ryncolin-1-like n=1 Tax=Branchiostoma floridae TaxID=7739 RepID=A0A9J7KPT1_BRAFL|nr:ryncolin-1-like [Branchiostoma floridae]